MANLRKQADMAKDTRAPIVLGTALGVPTQRCEVAAERDELAAEATANPAFAQIAEYLEHAKALGMDPAEPDVLRRAIDAGSAAWLREANVAASRDAWASAGSELAEEGAGRHIPVVYYVRLGRLVKIGTTTRIIERCVALGVQGVMALEFGDSAREHERHREFADLHSHGEWFELALPLADHIAQLRDNFEATTGTSVEGWLAEQRTRGAASRARRLLKVNQTLYSGACGSLPNPRHLETLVAAADAARLRGISPQLLNGWREQGKIQPVGAATDGRPLYRLGDIISLDLQQQASPKSHRSA